MSKQYFSSRVRSDLTVGLVLQPYLDPIVGAKLARDGGGSASMDVEWPDAFASRLAPTR
ncbi:hypothetical protein EMIT0P228_30278 [Pseudomonas brassicacearum]